jgi:hypothetical protein
MREVLVLLALAALVGGCSLALDLEALQKGTDTDTGSDTGPECAVDTDCNDGIDCTTDVCDEQGNCVALPNNDLCDYLEYCDPEQGCMPTGDECIVDDDCDDLISCTIDECQAGDCLNTVDDALCEDENPCIENEYCDPEVGCIEGNEMYCEQSGAPCTETVCNPDNGECEDVLIDGADDDGDTFLDATCGGDDCADTNEDAHPGADEICNYGDDDCDGLTDVTATVMPTVVQSGTSLHLPAVTHDGQDFAVIWQEGEGSGGAIYVRVVGPIGEMVTDPVNVTALGGGGTFGLEPDVALGDGEFLATWVSQLDTDDPEVLLVGLIVSGSIVTSSWDAIFLETGAAVSLASPRITRDADVAGSGWVAAWTAGYSDSSGSVELQTEDMHSHPTATFTASTWTGGAAGAALTVVGANDYALTWSRDDDASDGDLEVFASRIGLVTDQWDQTGYPLLISDANGSDTDPSSAPAVTADGSSNWVVAYTDVAGLSAMSNVLGWAGAGAIDLAVDDASDQDNAQLAWQDAGYGLAYIFDVGSAMALDFRLLDGALAPYGTQAGRLALAGAGEVLRDAYLVADQDTGFAAVWIDSDGTTDDVVFSSFEACIPPSK